MTIDKIDIIKSFEGLKLTAYQDTGGVWTIGYGTIQYPDGRKVKQGDVITQQQAEDYLRFEVVQKTEAINRYVKATLNQNQFDSICSFVYNIGAAGFRRSTMLKKININPDDPTIRNEFMKWVKDNGKIIQGLVNRRKAEAELYFSNIS